MESSRFNLINEVVMPISDEVADILLPYQSFLVEEEDDPNSDIQYSPTGGDVLIYNIALNVVVLFLVSLVGRITASLLIDYFTDPKLENKEVLLELVKEIVKEKIQKKPSNKEHEDFEVEEIISKNIERTRVILYKRGLPTNQATKVAEKIISHLSDKRIEIKELFVNDFEVITDQIDDTSTQQPIKILFVASNPSDTTRLRIDNEVRAIDEVLRKSEFRDKFALITSWAARVTDLQELLLRYQPNIVHFSGHSNEASKIIFEDDSGNSQPIPVEALSQLFSILKDNIQCVVLNTCYAEPQAQAIVQHIDCVIGMSTAITDEAAISFATAFYRALGFGRDIQTAFELGRGQINLANLGEQDIPKLLAISSNPKKIVLMQNKLRS